MHWWQLYLLMKLDSLIELFIAMTIVFSILGVIFLAANAEELNDRKAKAFLRRAMSSFILAILMFVTALLIPSTKQAATIWLLPKVVNNEHVQNISHDTLKLVESEIHKLLEKSVKAQGEHNEGTSNK